ncbi:MAG TPA: S53 family peptidase, partial [Candidatus Binataceae bacterium]|nr:S53 family peptidase [Candidatus Binataceae bacterium]
TNNGLILMADANLSPGLYQLSGSERTPMDGAQAIGAADPNERLEVTIVVRRPPSSALEYLLTAQAATGKFLTRAEFAQAHGADPADLDAVTAFATQHNLAVVERSAVRRMITLSGTVASFNQAFSVVLQNYEHPDGTYRGRTGSINLPGSLKDCVEGVFGLDNRPQATPHFRRLTAAQQAQAQQSSSSFTPPQIAQLYKYPAKLSGAGETIALIELGGGFKPADLSAYFKQLKITPAPKVSAVSVSHGRNLPTGSPDGPDGEVMLDIEVAGSIASGAHIVAYFAPNTDQGFLNAITTAIHDQANKPSIISISWGGPESTWTAQALQQFDKAFQEAASLGVTVTVAAGDNGSSDGVSDGANHVDFPASDPWVVACGGTRLVASGAAIASESVWNDGAQGGATGGGVSATFVRPGYQSSLNGTSGRGVPDVAGDADPQSGYLVRVDGHQAVFGGTSAVAPLWAGLIALINQAKGAPQGFINPKLYANPSALNDITVGNNGAFSAAAGWDACTGLGTPDGSALETIL